MTSIRWAHGVAALAMVAAGVAVAAPAAQAATQQPTGTQACAEQLLTADNNLAWASYDITLPYDDAIGGVIENAHIAQNALTSTACAGLQSSIGADVAAAQAGIEAGLQSVAQGRRGAASDQFNEADGFVSDAYHSL
jgi:hypothetical protein